jgi:GNAT superfamily N-acetyltransferase
VRLQVAFASAAPGAAPQLASAVLAYSRAHGYQIQWHVMPQRLGETDLVQALTGLGLHEVERQRLMAHDGPIRSARNAHVTIAPIEQWPAMVSYEAGSRGAFFDDPHPIMALVERRARERLYEQERGWCQYYAAILDGRPVGGCYYTLYEDIPTIMGVYTIAAARNRGVATTLLATVGDILNSMGRPIYCLYVKMGNPAERLYRALEFVPLLEEVTLEATLGEI